MRKLKALVLLFILVVLTLGCEMKTYTLQNGITKVPVDSTVYKNKSKFDKSLLTIIDTPVVYEAYNVERKTPVRLDVDYTHRFYGVYKFYSNGCLNYFTLNRDESIDTNTFNPLYRGQRGVYYLEKNQIKVDLITLINGYGSIGKLTSTFSFSNDTLYEHTNYVKYVTVYIKRKLPSGYLNYKANW